MKLPFDKRTGKAIAANLAAVIAQSVVRALDPKHPMLPENGGPTTAEIVKQIPADLGIKDEEVKAVDDLLPDEPPALPKARRFRQPFGARETVVDGKLTGYGDAVTIGDKVIVTLHKDGQDVVENDGQPVKIVHFIARSGVMAILRHDGVAQTVTYDATRASDAGFFVRTFKKVG